MRKAVASEEPLSLLGTWTVYGRCWSNTTVLSAKHSEHQFLRRQCSRRELHLRLSLHHHVHRPCCPCVPDHPCATKKSRKPVHVCAITRRGLPSGGQLVQRLPVRGFAGLPSRTLVLQGWLVLLFNHVHHDVHFSRLVLPAQEIGIHGPAENKEQPLVVLACSGRHHHHGPRERQRHRWHRGWSLLHRVRGRIGGPASNGHLLCRLTAHHEHLRCGGRYHLRSKFVLRSRFFRYRQVTPDHARVLRHHCDAVHESRLETPQPRTGSRKRCH